jgi:hypothetical protein
MPSRGIIAVMIVKRIESRVANQGFWLQTGRAVKAFSYGRASETAVVTLDITAITHLVVQSCMNNTLLRESIWWRGMTGSMLMRSAKRGLSGFVLLSFGLFKTIKNCQLTAITEQCCACLNTTSYGREELNECLTG